MASRRAVWVFVLLLASAILAGCMGGSKVQVSIVSAEASKGACDASLDRARDCHTLAVRLKNDGRTKQPANYISWQAKSSDGFSHQATRGEGPDFVDAGSEVQIRLMFSSAAGQVLTTLRYSPLDGDFVEVAVPAYSAA